MVKAENHRDKEERARKEGREHVQRDAGDQQASAELRGSLGGWP